MAKRSEAKLSVKNQNLRYFDTKFRFARLFLLKLNWKTSWSLPNKKYLPKCSFLFSEAYDVGFMRTHTTIFESDIIRPLDVIGLCVKQSESSEYATIVLECHNKAIEEIDIIQT